MYLLQVRRQLVDSDQELCIFKSTKIGGFRCLLSKNHLNKKTERTQITKIFDCILFAVEKQIKTLEATFNGLDSPDDDDDDHFINNTTSECIVVKENDTAYYSINDRLLMFLLEVVLLPFYLLHPLEIYLFEKNLVRLCLKPDKV